MITLGLRSSRLSFLGMLFFLLTVNNANGAGPFSNQDAPAPSLVGAKTLLLSGKTTYTVTVNPVVVGNAAGCVDSDVGNIHFCCNGPASCGSQTSIPLEKGTTIVLTVTVSGGVGGWDGCAAAGGIYQDVTCTFTDLNENKAVGVTFISL